MELLSDPPMHATEIPSENLDWICQQIYLSKTGAEHRPDVPLGNKDNLNEIYFIKKLTDDLTADVTPVLLKRYVTLHPQSRAGHTLKAEWYLRRGECALALASIQTSLAFHFDDLYAQEIYRRVVGTINSAAADREKALEEDLQKRFCHKPFEHFEVTADGNVYLCCPSYLPVPAGNIHRQTVSEIWNSDAAKSIRASINDASFRFCSRMACGDINAKALPLREHVVPPSDERPTKVHLTHDRACNLSCPSCRIEPTGNDPAKKAAFDAIEAKLLPHLEDATELSLIGSGDPLLSRAAQSLLSKLSRPVYPRLEIMLQTNGLLFTPAWWQRNPQLHEFPIEVHISVDAARAETYASVRRGGDFQTLQRNLEFISGLRKLGPIRKLGLKFVVQKENFLEMKDFVALGTNLGADVIMFSRLRNWGTYSSEEFIERDVAAPGHPEYPQLCDLLRDSAFAHPSIHLAL